METVEQTKLRLLREAVHDNIKTVSGIKYKSRVRRKRSHRLWLWLPLLLVGFGYFGLPTIGVSRGNVFVPDPASSLLKPSRSTESSAPVEPNAALATPRPLSRAILPLSIKTIVIDPGHGGRQTGAISDSGVAEKNITLDVALRLYGLMKKSPFAVYLTRKTDRTMPLEQRVDFANSKKADLFVSIHVNWMEPRYIRGPETYYVGPSNDAATLSLASLENRESSYSFADYRQILDKIYVDTRRDESRRLARSVQTALYRSLRQTNPDVENRGVKMAPFVVLVGTQMPAILVEISCLSNDDEVKLLTSSEYREKIAMALFKGIRSYAGRLNRSDRKGS